MMHMDVKGSRVEVFDLCFDRIRSNKRILFHPKPKVENSLLGRTQFLKITKFDESVETNIFFSVVMIKKHQFGSSPSNYSTIGPNRVERNFFRRVGGSKASFVRVDQNIAHLGPAVKRWLFN